MKRIVLTIAIAAIAAGASTTAASARLPIDGDEAAVISTGAQAPPAAKKAKKAKKQQKDSRPAKVVYLGRH
jgi:hypothetical protein